LVFSSKDNYLCSYITWNNISNRLDIEINQNISVGFIRLNNFSGKGLIFINYPYKNDSTYLIPSTIKVSLNSITPILCNQSKTLSFNQYNRSFILEYEILENESDFYHFITKTIDDKYAIYNLAIFNDTITLKNHIYDRICCYHNSSTRYYLIIQNLDERNLDLEVYIEFKRGYIDDNPWYPYGFGDPFGIGTSGIHLVFLSIILISLTLYSMRKLKKGKNLINF